MSLFDWFVPKPDLACPRCGRTLTEWQGKDGARGLFVWEQGAAAPIDQRVDEEVRLAPAEAAKLRLPASCLIYTDCSCGSEFLVEALCSATDGVWTETRLVTVEDIDAVHYDESRERRAARKKWLERG
jgi:hypothetical protein